MVKGSEKRTNNNNADQIFIDRWSPRAMSGEPLSEEDARKLFEAARWAPSSMNNQPWRFIYSINGDENWDTFFNLLNAGNQKWAGKAGMLMVIVSKNTFDTGKESVTHSYDTGAAWVSLALQGSLMGLVVHGMQGFDYEAARDKLGIPEGYTVEAMAAAGKPGEISELPENLQQRESPNDRKPIEETIRRGHF